MQNRLMTYFKKINFQSLIMAWGLMTICMCFNANAAYDYGTGSYLTQQQSSCKNSGNCVAYSGGTNSTPCPAGTRYDISQNCLQKINAGNSNCVNTMPVEKVGRVPEDVCYRTSAGREHEGMDYGAAGGSKVFAAADGIVDEANYCSKGYGLKIVIFHDKADTTQSNLVSLPKKSSFTTLYAHLSEILVTKGQRVKKDQLIGRVGGTNCSGLEGDKAYKSYDEHLHFEIRDGANAKGKVLDPMCDNIQSLCGVCSKDFKPSDCRVDCKKNPNLEHCKKPTGMDMFDLSKKPNDFAVATWPKNPYLNTDDQRDNYIERPINDGERRKGKKDCNINTYRNTFTTCIFCDLFRVLFDTASIIAGKAYTALSAAVTSVVIVGMALWLAFTIIKFISSMEAKEPRILVKTIINQAFVVLIVIILLKTDMKTFLGMALEPIFNTGMNLAQIVTSGSGGADCTGFTQVTDQGAIPASMGNNILCTIKSIQTEILDIMAIGSTALCVGFFVESWNGIFLLPHLGYVIVGIILWITAFLLLVIYPFLLIDSILQLSVASALLPAAIGTYAFPMTRKKYVSKVWETFMNAMFTFLFLSIIIFIITAAIKSVLGETITDTLSNAGTNNNAYEVIIDAVNGLAWWGIKFLQLVFLMLLGWGVLDEAKSFAGNFTKGGIKFSGDMGSNLGTTAMSGVKGLAAPVAEEAMHQVSEGGKAVGRTIHEKRHTAKVNRMANNIKNDSSTTRDAEGNMVVKSKNWRGKEITKTLSTDATGNSTITTTKGNKTVVTDKFMTITTEKDAKGVVYSEKVKMEAAGCRSLVNKDGTLNEVAINAMLQNSKHSKEDINKAIMNQVMRERMPQLEAADMNMSFISRQVVVSEDNKIEIKQVNTDGSTTIFKMETVGGRAMTSVEQLGKNGSARLYQSDGVINKKSTYKYVDGKISEKSLKNQYAFNSYYTKFGGSPMDSNGVFSNGVKESDILFGEEDLEMAKEQISVFGKPKSFSEFK